MVAGSGSVIGAAAAPRVRASNVWTATASARPGAGAAQDSGRSRATAPVERGREAGLGARVTAAAAAASGDPAPSAPRIGRADFLVELLRDADDAREQEEREADVRNTSPIETTFWMIGSGIGMTSPNGPRWSRKSASSGGRQDEWMAE